MRARMFRIMLCFVVWLIPVAGIYFGVQVLHNAIGIVIAVISGLSLMPLSGNLFDAFTNNRVLYLNIDRPWKSHLDNPSVHSGKE